MDYCLERERSRINKIISKFACNYTSPISLAKQAMNKMTRHKKVYSYEFESIKEQDSNMRSDKMLLEQSYNRIAQERNESLNSNDRIHHSSQHIFTFQTLREAMAVNPELVYLKYHENSEKNTKVMQVREKKKNEMEKDKVLKYLPSLKRLHEQSPNKKQDFLNVVSHRVMTQVFKNPEDRSKFSKLSEIDSKDLQAYEDQETQKELRSFDRKIKGFMPGVIRKKHKETAFMNGSSKNSRILHVVLPKYHKKNYFADPKANRNFSDEDTSVKGWEKHTPLDMLDSSVPN